MSRMKIVIGLLVAAVVVALVGPITGDAAQAQTTVARVRFLHAVPGAPAVDIYLDGAALASGVAYGEVTPHINVDGGDHAVILRQAGTAATAAPLMEVPVSLVASLAFTVVVQGTPTAIEAVVYEDILDELDPGFARLTAINAVADAPALDVLTSEGGPLLQGVSYGAQFGTVNIGTGVQDLVLVPAGGAVDGALASVGEVALQSGTLYTFVVLGTLDGSVPVSTIALPTPVNPKADSVRVRVAHGSPDAPAVDVYAGDTLIVPSLALGEMSGHIGLPAGDYTLALRTAGAPATDDPVFETEATIALGMPAVTVAALGELADGSLNLQFFPDDVANITPDKARVSVINAVFGSFVTVSTADFTPVTLASEVSTFAQSGVADLDVGDHMLSADVQGSEGAVQVVVPAETYYGGMYYNVLVFGGGASATPIDASVGGTVINVTAESLTTPAPAAVAAAPAAETETETEPAPAAEGTEVDAGAEVATDSEVVAMDAQPDTQPEVVDESPAAPATDDTELVMDAAPDTEVVIPQATPDADTPLATVELNQGANLQCREYPRSEARSLGLIPSGTTVIVVGRTGEPLVPETGNPTPEPTPVVESIDDLWLSVRWDQADGGYLRCWVSARYLRVELKGKYLLELEDLMEKLPEEPFNQPGEAVGTVEQPPTPLYDAVLATVQLDPGVALQLRRYPDSDAEVLERVPAQTQLEALGYVEAPSEGLIGQPTSPIWLQVRYRLETGGSWIGWVSAQYVVLTRWDRSYEIEDLPEADPTEGGYLEAAGEPLPIPLELQDVIGTVDLNPGANLNLRDNPRADAFRIVGIPSSASMVINGRNGDGTWVQVTYEPETGALEGWVASQYLIVTRGGEPWPIKDLEILTGEADTMTEE